MLRLLPNTSESITWWKIFNRVTESERVCKRVMVWHLCGVRMRCVRALTVPAALCGAFNRIHYHCVGKMLKHQYYLSSRLVNNVRLVSEVICLSPPLVLVLLLV